MRMPACREERPECRRTVEIAQVSEASRVGSAGQMCDVRTRGWTVCVGERVRRVGKHVMRSCTARPVAERRPAAMRYVNMRAASADPDVRPTAEAAGAADMPHAMAAEMGCEMRPTAAEVPREMRNASSTARCQVRPATANVRREMWPAATDMRCAAANMRGAARMSAAAGVTTARSWRRNSRAGRQTQGQADGGDARRNGSRLDHNILPKCICARDRTRALNRCKQNGGL